MKAKLKEDRDVFYTTIEALSTEGKLNQRADGRVEWVCEHGVGHTIMIPDWVKKKSKELQDAWWLHGCDGCCSKLKLIAKEKHKHDKI